jgi:hypothetical protein
MKELFKHDIKKFMTIFFDDKVDVENRTFRDIKMVPYHSENGDVNFLFQEIPAKRSLEFHRTGVSEKEEDFAKNYGNLLTTIRKEYLMIVVESDETKVSIKIFSGLKIRGVGKRFFKIRKNLTYLTVNKKTGDVYTGALINFNLKTKKRSNIQKNNFYGNFVQRLVQEVKSKSVYGGTKIVDKLIEALNVFAKEFSVVNEDVNLVLSDKLLEFYLKKKNIKYPNNYKLFWGDYNCKISLPFIRKNGNKLVDAFMKKNELKGNSIKKVLHKTENINLPILNLALFMFPNDWVYQDEELIYKCLNYSNKNTAYYPDRLGDNVEELKMSNSEKRRMFNIFSNEVILNKIALYTFLDHISFYRELKLYGEEIKWTAKTKDEFTQEHLEFSDKVDYYKKGHYYREYPKYMYELLEKPFKVKEDTYYPVLLDNSSNYTQESNIQSNCVKNYVGTSGSIIISLRKGDENSEIRATIEFRIYNKNETISFSVPQALGKYNSNLGENWEEPLETLKKTFHKCIKDSRFETVKLKKVFKNGKELSSESEWDDYGNLRWMSVDITKYY